jgi:hypothetical protein
MNKKVIFLLLCVVMRAYTMEKGFTAEQFSNKDNSGKFFVDSGEPNFSNAINELEEANRAIDGYIATLPLQEQEEFRSQCAELEVELWDALINDPKKYEEILNNILGDENVVVLQPKDESYLSQMKNWWDKQSARAKQAAAALSVAAIFGGIYYYTHTR